MLIFNTLSGNKESLPETGRKPLRLFVCGPTVYDYLHIGNARVYIFFDTFVRFLKSKKIKVFYLKNITDIDDKIIARAKEEGITPRNLAKKYTAIFKKNIRALRIVSVTKYAAATQFIPEIIQQVKTLIEKKHAYEIPGDGWYFDLTTFPEYGKLARRTTEQAEDGVSRIDTNEKKRNRGDFCLWKFSPPAGGENEPTWKAPFGNGRPGWHIEDTAISETFFGPQYDIHGAGRDLIFPHHEAEIAQQESASGKKPFVKLWMHVGLLTVDGKKMSKSLGNFMTINDFIAQHSANVLRLLSLQNHYRSSTDFNEKGIADAKQTIATFSEFLAKLDLVKSSKKKGEENFDLTPYEEAFEKAMEDDVNTPIALASIFNFLHEANDSLWNISGKSAKSLKEWFTKKLEIFGIELKSPKIPQKITTLAKKRELSRIHKQFTQSDALRKEIEGLGYRVEDTPVGPLVLKK